MSRDRDTSRRSGLDVLVGFVALVLGLLGGAGLAADLAAATTSAMFGRRSCRSAPFPGCSGR